MRPSADAIELWCEEVEKCKFSVPQMSEKETGLLVNLSLSAEKIDNDKELLSLVESKQAGMLSVFWLRVKHCHTYKVSMSLAAFISEVIIKNNFGKSTMMANYLQWICHKQHLPKITLKEFCIDVFPMGFPTDEQWHKLWDLQKVDVEYLQPDGELYGHPDNILDYTEFAETIRSI